MVIVFGDLVCVGRQLHNESIVGQFLISLGSVGKMHFLKKFLHYYALKIMPFNILEQSGHLAVYHQATISL